MGRLALIACVLAASARPSEACTPVGNSSLDLDAMFADDVVAPAAPTIESIELMRYKGSTSSPGCPPVGIMTLTVSATDDRAPADRLGYDLDPVGADPASLADIRVRDALGSQLYYNFDYDTPAFEADYELRTVDLNGNLSAPTPLHVSYAPAPTPDGDADADDGCSVAGGGNGSLASLALALLALLYARRDARPPA